MFTRKFVGSLPALLILLAMLLPLPTLAFQSWVTIDPSKPEGSPPEISILEHNDDFTRLTVKIPGFWCEQVYAGGETFQRISVPVYGTKMVDGKPELPVVRGLLAYNPLKEANMIEVLNADWQDFYNYLIYPHQPDHLLEEAPPPFEWDEQFYQQDAWYPGDEVLLSDPGKIRDIEVVNNHIQCFQYNPLREHLKVASEMEVRVSYQTPEFGGGDGAEGEPTNGVHKDFIPMLESCVWNFNEIGFYPTPVGCDYLTITANDYEPALAPLVTLLNDRGYTVDVVKMSEIPKAVGALGIYGYINHRYDVDRIAYVLLVGDVQDFNGATLEPLNPNKMVPIPYWIPGYESYYPSWLSPSDVCYACLDRCDPPSGSPPSDPWDEWWENASSGDWYPDVYVGRFCADNISQVQSAVNKTIYYEEKLDPQDSGLTDSNWYERMLFVAYKIDPNYGDHFYQTLYSIIYDETYDIELPQTTLLWGETPGVTNDTVMQDIENGCNIVNYYGHGGWQDWGTGNPHVGWTKYIDSYRYPGPYVHFYEEPHVKDLTNEHLVVVFNVGCNMACIDGRWGDSLCDYWLRTTLQLVDPYQGGVAAIGATRMGVGFYDTPLDKALFHTMYGTPGDGVTPIQPVNILGVVHYATLARVFSYFAEPGETTPIEDRLQYLYNYIIIGEPSLEIRNEYTEQGPKNNQRVELHLNKIPIKLSVYPNPCEGLFTLKIEGYSSAVKEVTVYDLSGRAIEKIEISGAESSSTSLIDATSERELNIDLSDLSQGLYILGVGDKTFAKVVICK